MNKYTDILNSRNFSILCNAVGGIERAYILHRIDCWVDSNAKHNKAYAAGYYWMFATLKQLHDQEFSFMSDRNFQRHIYALKDMGVLISDLHNRKRTSRQWYRIDYNVLTALCEAEKAKSSNSELDGDTLPSFRQNDEYSENYRQDDENSSRQNDEYPSETFAKLTNTSRQNDENEPQTYAKMTNSFRQNGETIETKEETIYLYSSLFGSFSLLKKIFYEKAADPDANLDEFEDKVLDFIKQKAQLPFPKDFETAHELVKFNADTLRMLRMIRERRENNRYEEEYHETYSDRRDGPDPTVAVSAGDLFKKYGNPFAC